MNCVIVAATYHLEVYIFCKTNKRYDPRSLFNTVNVSDAFAFYTPAKNKTKTKVHFCVYISDKCVVKKKKKACTLYN